MAVTVKPFEQVFPIDKIIAQKRAEGLSDTAIQQGLAAMKASYEKTAASLHNNTTLTHGLSIIGGGAALGAGLGAGAGAAAGTGTAAGTTAGTGGSILGTAEALGPILGGIVNGRQQGREAEANATQRQDQNAIAAANTNLSAGSHRAGQAMQGDYLANAKDFQWGAPTMVGNIPVPSSTGGWRPSMFSDATRKLGTQLSSDALRDQTTNGGRAVDLTPLPSVGAGDSILNGAATFANLLSVLPYKKKPPVVAPGTPSPWGPERLNGMGY